MINDNVSCKFNNDKMQLLILLFTESRQAGFVLSIIKLM